MWQAAANTSAKELLVLAALLLIGLAVAGWPWQNLDAGKAAATAPLRWTRFAPLLGLSALLLLSAERWYAGGFPSLASAAASLQHSTLNARDRLLQQKGYYENLDNHQTGIHDYFKFLKFGFSRATDIASLHVRRGRLTRNDALQIVRSRDGRFPWTYLGKPLADIPFFASSP